MCNPNVLSSISPGFAIAKANQNNPTLNYLTGGMPHVLFGGGNITDRLAKYNPVMSAAKPAWDGLGISPMVNSIGASQPQQPFQNPYDTAGQSQTKNQVIR